MATSEQLKQESTSAPQLPEREPHPLALRAVKCARYLTHIFFYCLLGSFCLPPLGFVALPGFLLSYVAWVVIVLFCFMNYSLGALMGLFITVGFCVSLFVIGHPVGIGIGALGILIISFWTVAVISRHDPTAALKKNRKPQPATTDS